MTIYRSESHLFSYSATGKKHLSSGIKNQDSCLARKFRGGVVLAVADGVGSCKYPKKASRKAVKCLLKTARAFSRKTEIDEQFIHLFSTKFQKGFRNIRKGMSTTLLFAVAYDDGRVAIGQAGDGAMISGFNGTWSVFKKKSDDFTNETYALNAAKPYRGWAFKAKKITNPGTLSFCAFTDGLSEDVLDLVAFAKGTISKLLDNKEDELISLVDKWPVPGSTDDKTLAMMTVDFKERLSDGE